MDSRIYFKKSLFEALGVELGENKIVKYKPNWLNHVSRMENTRIKKVKMLYKPMWTSKIRNNFQKT